MTMRYARYTVASDPRDPDYDGPEEYNEAEEIWGDTPQALGWVPETAVEVAERSIDEVD